MGNHAEKSKKKYLYRMQLMDVIKALFNVPIIEPTEREIDEYEDELSEKQPNNPKRELTEMDVLGIIKWRQLRKRIRSVFAALDGIKVCGIVKKYFKGEGFPEHWTVIHADHAIQESRLLPERQKFVRRVAMQTNPYDKIIQPRFYQKYRIRLPTYLAMHRTKPEFYHRWRQAIR